MGFLDDMFDGLDKAIDKATKGKGNIKASGSITINGKTIQKSKGKPGQGVKQTVIGNGNIVAGGNITIRTKKGGKK